MRMLIVILITKVLLRCGQQGLTYVGHVQGVTTQANASLKQILEQHGITGTPTLLQQLVSFSLARHNASVGLSTLQLSHSSMAKEYIIRCM